MPEELMHPRSHIEKNHLFDAHTLRKRKTYSLSTGGKSLMSAESLLKKEENLSESIRLFCMKGETPYLELNREGRR